MQDATRVNRILASLERMTGPDLLLRLWPVVLRIGRLVRGFRRDELSPEGMFKFESALDSLLREIGRLIMEWLVNCLEPKGRQEMPRQLLWEGEYYRRGRKSNSRNLNCLFGPISLRRFYYQRLESRGPCLFPLEKQLGIAAGVATPALADVVARAAADLTQRQLLDQLLERRITWGVGTLRKLTKTMADNLSPHRHQAQVEQLLSWVAAASAKPGPRQVTLSVGRDGIMVPVVKNSKYKEASTATVSVMDRHGRRVGTVYLGQMPEPHQTTLSAELTALVREVLSHRACPPLRLVYVTDCGHHPTEYFENVLRCMGDPWHPGKLLRWEWIVDYYHACQYITKLGEAIFGLGRKASAWAAKQRRVLKKSTNGVFRVLRSAGALLTTRGLVGTQESYDTAYSFLRERASKMDYQAYRKLRLPIGSGITEAACKIVFTQRFKQSGMKWSLEGGKPILVLRTISLSKIWNQVRDAALRTYKMPIPVTPRQFDYSTPANSLRIAA